jgi:hypothetical protein
MREVSKVLLHFILQRPIVFLIVAFAQRHTAIAVIAISLLLLLCVGTRVIEHFISMRPFWHRHASQAHSTMVTQIVWIFWYEFPTVVTFNQSRSVAFHYIKPVTMNE